MVQMERKRRKAMYKKKGERVREAVIERREGCAFPISDKVRKKRRNDDEMMKRSRNDEELVLEIAKGGYTNTRRKLLWRMS